MANCKLAMVMAVGAVMDTIAEALLDPPVNPGIVGARANGVEKLPFTYTSDGLARLRFTMLLLKRP